MKKRRPITPTTAGQESHSCAPGPQHNCWEFMRCGREPGGCRADDLGICIAAVDSRLDGINGGTNAGRCCWLVAGTFCDDQVQGTFADKHDGCEHCDFYQKVQAEGGENAKQIVTLIRYWLSSDAGEREHYTRILENLMDRSVTPLALSNLKALKQGEEKPITAFFSDLSGFSLISEQLANPELLLFLKEYFSTMTDILKAEGGTIDKYVGDALVGMFGAPVALENTALAAARASLRMLSRLDELRDEWKQHNLWCPAAWSLRARVGLSSGVAEVGFFGTRDFVSYSMAGPVVNLAAWLEQACKHYGSSILVSEATHSLIADKMVLRRLDRIRPKGKAKAECIYELVGQQGCIEPEMERAVRLFTEAQDLREGGRWSEAARLFREVLRLRSGKDPPAARLLSRCERRASRPIPTSRSDDPSNSGRA